MRSTFLGDANDHLKGSVHSLLRAAGAIRDLHAVPMATDDWLPEHRNAYSRLLGLADAERVVPTSRFSGLRAQRGKYCAEAARGLPVGADAIVDPDTGIRELDAGRSHVLIAELQLLIGADRERLLIVYDESHDRRVPKRRHVEVLGGLLVRSLGRTVAYEAGRSLTLFIAGPCEERVERAHDALAAFLGPAQEGRLHQFT